MKNEIDGKVVKLSVVGGDDLTPEAQAALDDATARARADYEVEELARENVMIDVADWRSMIIVGYDSTGTFRTATFNIPCHAHAHWMLTRVAHQLTTYADETDPLDPDA